MAWQLAQAKRERTGPAGRDGQHDAESVQDVRALVEKEVAPSKTCVVQPPVVTSPHPCIADRGASRSCTPASTVTGQLSGGPSRYR